MGTREDRITDFLKKLSSATPTPGGGSAAALTGSLAAALVTMVASLTVGKKAYQSVEAEMHAVLKEAAELRDRLMELVDRDTETFNRVMEAYKMPGETDAEKRIEKLQPALKQATEIPYQVAQGCYRTLELAEIVAIKGNKNAISDGGAAACLAEGALHAALLSVDINLAVITDESFRNEYARKREGLSQKAQAKRQAILRAIAAHLTR